MGFRAHAALQRELILGVLCHGTWCPVRDYMTTGKVKASDKEYLRTVAEKASTWTDPEVKTAGLALAAVL